VGANAPRVRLIGFVAGLFYLELVLYLGTQDDDFGGLATISSLLAAAGLLATRFWMAPLRRLDQIAPGASFPSFQFSIRGLMTLTFVVAVSITGIKILQANSRLPELWFELFLWTAGVAATGLASTWATLTTAPPGPRCALVFLFALATGALVAYGFNEGWMTYFYLITITLLQAVVVLATLLAVRWFGSRLTRRSKRK
jgi:hypothetical protein